MGSKKAYHRSQNIHQAERPAHNIQVEEQSAAEFSEDRLKLAVEAYFCQVIDSGECLTALDYHQHQELSIAPEVWIYQIVGSYQALSQEEQSYFALDTAGAVHPIFNHNYIIRDTELGLRYKWVALSKAENCDWACVALLDKLPIEVAVLMFHDRDPKGWGKPHHQARVNDSSS